MYEVTWQQSGDGSSLRNTTTTECLTPGTSYEVGVGAYCRENPNIRSEIVHSFVSTMKMSKSWSYVKLFMHLLL